MLVCLFRIYKAEGFAKILVSALVAKHKDNLSLSSYLIFGQFWAKAVCN